MKKLSKKQKTVEAQRQIKKMLREQITPKLLKDVEAAINNADDELMVTGCHVLSKFVLDEFCIERPFKPMSDFQKVNFKKLKK